MTPEALAQRTQQLETELARHKIMEENLRKSEAQFRTIAETSPIGIALMGPTGQCVYTNRIYQKMIGLTFDETLADGWESSIHPEDVKQLLATWRGVVAHGQAFESTHRLLKKDQTVLWVNVKAAAIKEDQEVKGFVVTMADITREKQLQAELTAKLKEVQVLNNVMMGREERILELKEQLRALQAKHS